MTDKKKPPNSPKDESKVDRDNVLQTDNQTEPLVPGQLYYCCVKEILKPQELVMCDLADGSGRNLPSPCTPAIGIFSGLLGFRTNWLPPKGTRVIVMHTGEEMDYIIGAHGLTDEGDTIGLGRSSTGADLQEGETPVYGWMQGIQNFREKLQKGTSKRPNNQHNFGPKPPWDMVEGEMEITNQLGVALNLSRHMASLKAADLAKVECHIIDDMVRIISQTFKHYSAFGDYKIFNDGGRLNIRWDGTNVDWETYGHEAPAPREPLHPKWKDTGVPTKQQLENDARWRFSQFVGFLGDFINIFVTDPAETIQQHPHVFHKARSGKGRIHVNEDGSIILQTVGDVAIEKVCRIPVPLERKPEYHPEGDLLQEEWDEVYLSPPKLDPLQIWDYGSSGGLENAHFTVYQIRKYVKWFSNKYTKAQFIRLDKDWNLPKEADVPEPVRKDQQQLDKRLANEDLEVPTIEAYATVRIQKDGSVLVMDAYDNTIVLSKGGVQLSSTNNVQIEAAASINMVAGRDINMVAKNNIDISALQKGISVRSKTFFQQYCQEGGILFETDQVPEEEEDDGSVGHIGVQRVWGLQDDPRSDHSDPNKIQGIYFKSKYHSMRMEAGIDIGLKTRGGSILSTPAQDFAVSTGGRFQVNDTMEIWNAKSRSATNHDFDAPFTADPEEGQTGVDDAANDGLGLVKVDGLCMIAKTYTNFLVQYADNFRPMLCDCSDYPGSGIPTKCVVNMKTGKWRKKHKSPYCHPGHVLTTRKQQFDTVITETDALKYKKHISVGKFAHRNIKEYGTSGSEDPKSAEALYQTVTQNSLDFSLQSPELVLGEFEDWNYTEDIKLPDVERGAAWPGKDIKYLRFTPSFNPTSPDGDPKLWNPDVTDPKNYHNVVAPLVPESIIYKHLKEPETE